MQEQEQMVRKSMTFEELVPIWNAVQRHNARLAIRKVDRAKKQLTYVELLNKFAQLGNVVRYKNIAFTFDRNYAMGVLVTPQGKILGATIHDFLALVKKLKESE